MGLWSFFEALGIIGLVVLIDASPLWLPNIKPFNCPLCKCSWLAIFYYFAYRWQFDGMPWDQALLSVGVVSLLAILLMGLYPFIFRSISGDGATNG